MDRERDEERSGGGPRPQMPDPAGLLEVEIGKPLPDAESAHIDSDKLRCYALDPENAVGRHKAAVFAKALEIYLEDWEYVRRSILDQLASWPVTDVRPPTRPEERYTWEVLVPISGLRATANRRLLLVTAWEMIAERPELVTLRVAPQRRQPTW